MADSILQGYFNPTISTLTWTSLASLGNSATVAAECLKVDNSANLFLGADLELTIKSHASSTPNGYVTIYMAASIDNSVFPGGAAGTDSGPTVQTENLTRIGSVFLSVANTTYKRVLCMEAGYGGMRLPPYFSLIAVNQSGFALAASGSSARFVGSKVKALGV